jgi:hypothetical protein
VPPCALLPHRLRVPSCLTYRLLRVPSCLIASVCLPALSLSCALLLPYRFRVPSCLIAFVCPPALSPSCALLPYRFRVPSSSCLIVFVCPLALLSPPCAFLSCRLRAPSCLIASACALLPYRRLQVCICIKLSQPPKKWFSHSHGLTAQVLRSFPLLSSPPPVVGARPQAPRPKHYAASSGPSSVKNEVASFLIFFFLVGGWWLLIDPEETQSNWVRRLCGILCKYKESRWSPEGVQVRRP